ncbi:MAG: energy-coupling factor transporter transmembrane component T family protein [Suipraeoptans sp.]
MRDLLYRINPICKIWMLIVLVIPVSFSKDIIFPMLTLAFIIISGILFADISILKFITSMKVIVLSAFCLCIFLVFTRAINQTGDFTIGIFGILTSDIVLAVSLSLRMIGFAYAAFIFSKTTEPSDLAVSLIKYWKVPPQAGYSFLVAYRYVPMFHSEFQKVQIAHEVRAAGGRKGKIFALFKLPTYLFPMMVQAIRSGERVAIAMEARAFCSSPKRSYYKDVNYGKSENIALAVCCLVLISMLLGTILTNTFVFGLGF